MVGGCSAEIRAATPWLATLGWCWKEVEALLSFGWKEEEEVGVGRVGRKAEQAGGAARLTGPKSEEKFFLE
jgi:hypothetical protein